MDFNKRKVHRLFAKDMLSRPKGLHGDGRVGIGGRADEHCVDPGIAEKGAVILCHKLRACRLGQRPDRGGEVRRGDAPDLCLRDAG